MKPKNLRKHAKALEFYATRMEDQKETSFAGFVTNTQHHEGWKKCYNDVIKSLYQSADLLRYKASIEEVIK